MTDGVRPLADQLARLRDRGRAVARLAAAHPEAPLAIREAFDAGRSRYGRLLDADEFADAAWTVLARSWRRCLRTAGARGGPAPGIPEMLAPFRCRYLPDLYLAAGARRETARSRETFYAMHPGLRDRSQRWWDGARARFPGIRLEVGDYQTKVFGSVLHHFLRAAALVGLECAPPELPDLAEVVRLLPDRLEARGAPDGLFLLLALALGDAAAERHFLARYDGTLEDHLARQGVRPGQRDDWLPDVRVEVFLRGCTYFGAGSVEGWLWSVVESVLARERRMGRRIGQPLPEEKTLAAREEDPDALEPDERARCEEAVRRAFEVLDEAGRDLLSELFLDGRSLSEVAAEKGVQVSTVGRARDRWLSRLQEGAVVALAGPGGEGRSSARALLARFAAEPARTGLDVRALLRRGPPPPAPAPPEHLPPQEPDGEARGGDGCRIPQV